MSKEKFRAFSAEISQDDDLQNRVKQIDDPSELIKLGREKGFNFTIEHIRQSLTELKKETVEYNNRVNSTSALEGSMMPYTPRILPELDGLEYFSEAILNLAN